MASLEDLKQGAQLFVIATNYSNAELFMGQQVHSGE
jgi:hypothetical protein